MKLRPLAIPILFVAPLAFAHVVRVVQGVHFKAERIDFGLPPARSARYSSDGIWDRGNANAWRPGTKFFESRWIRPEEFEQYKRQEAKVLGRVFRLELSRDYSQALRKYEQLNALNVGDPNFVRSRIELLSTPGIANEAGLDAYLAATRRAKRSRFTLPKASPVIQAWVAFTHATKPAEYVVFANRYPNSTRVPAALITAARLLTHSGATEYEFTKAKELAGRLRSEHPKSRFAWEAKGAIARIDFLSGRLTEALAQYEAQLSVATTVRQQERALQSILLCLKPGQKLDALAYAYLRWYDRSQITEPYTARKAFISTLKRFQAKDAARFFDRLQRDPRAFSAYLDLRSQLDPGAKDILEVGQKARRATAGTVYRGHVDSMLARTALARTDPRARTYATDALKAAHPDDQARGRFVLATLDRYSGKTKQARDGYREIIRRYPKSYLVGGARENLALMSERLGDLQTALDQYLTLDYEYDIAYLIDVRMSPAQLEEAVRRHPNDGRMRYTLAMRYLRKEDWDGAERALSGFSRKERRRLASSMNWYWNSDEKIQDPLATLKSLRRLDANFKRAKSKEAKAKALLAQADYYYNHHDLLLYSLPAWQGGRDYTFSFSWNQAVASPADMNARERHYAEHECFAQALRRYQEVVHDYPNSSVATRAAYWGGTAAARLSHMSQFWRTPERAEPLLEEAVYLLKFASKSRDPKIAAKAKKYARVFGEELRQVSAAFSTETFAETRWNPSR